MLPNRTPVERQRSTPPFAHDTVTGARVANARHHAGRVLAEWEATQRETPMLAMERRIERIEAALFALAERIKDAA